jgi:hypothetical protein
VADDGSALFRAHPEYVEIQTLTGLHLDTEAEALASFYAGSEGLQALKQALQAQGHSDSFAYFLGTAGKKNGDIPTGEENPEEIGFISERNPAEICQQRGKKNKHNALDPVNGKIAAEYGNCRGNPAAARIRNMVQQYSRNQPEHPCPEKKNGNPCCIASDGFVKELRFCRYP